MNITPDTTLIEVFDKYYLRHRLAKGFSASSRQFGQAFRIFKRATGRQPTVADLTKESIDAALKVIATRKEKRYEIKLMRNRFLNIWRFLGDMGIVDNAPPRKVDANRNDVAALKWSPRRLRSIADRQPVRLGDIERVSEPSPDESIDALLRYFAYRRLRGKRTNTLEKYRGSIRVLTAVLKRPPLISDLTNENIEAVMWHSRSAEKGNSIETANAHRSKLVSVWNFAWREGIVRKGPSVGKLRAPHRIPTAWSREELHKLFAAVKEIEGFVAGVPFPIWMTAFLRVIWDSGERLNAVLCLSWENLNTKSGLLTIPAELRKGNSSDMQFKLSTETLAALDRLHKVAMTQGTAGDAIFPFDLSESMLFAMLRAVLRRAELPCGRRDLYHKLRRSVASHYAAKGGDATALLGHFDASVTRRYLAPDIVGARHASEVLFDPTIGGES